MPFVFNDKCPWFSVQKIAKVPQLQRSFKVADVPVVQVVLVPQVRAFCGYGRPVIMQRQVGLGGDMPVVATTGAVLGQGR